MINGTSSVNRSGEKKVEYVELFFDLIFVYSIRNLNLLVHDPSHGFMALSTFLNYSICIFIILQIWFFTTMMLNKYGTRSILEDISIFINMYLLYYMGEGISGGLRAFYSRYYMAWGLILVNLTVMYALKLYFFTDLHADDRHLIHVHMGILLIEAAMVFACIPLYSRTGLSLSLIPIAFGLGTSLITYKLNRLRPVDFPHMTERVLLLVILTFGEMIIGVAHYFDSGSGIVFNALAFLIAVGMFLAYGFSYDHMLNRNKVTGGVGFMLIHLLLIYALNNVTLSLEFLAESSENYVVEKTLFLLIFVVLYYLALYLTERYAGVRFQSSFRYRLTLSIVAASYLILMGITIFQQVSNIILTALFVYAILILMYLFWKRRSIMGL